MAVTPFLQVSTWDHPFVVSSSPCTHELLADMALATDANVALYTIAMLFCDVVYCTTVAQPEGRLHVQNVRINLPARYEPNSLTLSIYRAYWYNINRSISFPMLYRVRRPCDERSWEVM